MKSVFLLLVGIVFHVSCYTRPIQEEIDIAKLTLNDTSVAETKNNTEKFQNQGPVKKGRCFFSSPSVRTPSSSNWDAGIIPRIQIAPVDQRAQMRGYSIPVSPVGGYPYPSYSYS